MEEFERNDTGKKNHDLLSRRDFLKITAGAGTGLLLAGCKSDLATFLAPASDSPLESYYRTGIGKRYTATFMPWTAISIFCAPPT